MNITKQQSFRVLALQLRHHHLCHCDGATCNISLDSIREMAEAAGATFTAEEKKKFPTFDIIEVQP